MVRINNTNVIKKVLKFEGNRYYYKFAVIVRQKDYPENECPILNKEGRREVCVHQWLVQSLEDYERLLPDMLKYVELFQARLYITLDRKDLYKTLIYAQKIVTDAINSVVLGQQNMSAKSVSKLTNSITSVSESNSKEGKCWLFDVDTKDFETLQNVIRLIGDHYICMLNTKAGYHIVADKKFNARNMTMIPNVEIKENAMALVAMY